MSRGNELSSRLGRILAAIMGTNGDSVRKIPARHKGIVKMKKIPVRQKGLVFQNKQIVLLVFIFADEAVFFGTASDVVGVHRARIRS